MISKAKSVRQYLAQLPADRRAALQSVRQVILEHLDKDFEEGMQYGMIGYTVPHRLYAAGYLGDPAQPLPLACLASQKNHMALYLMCVYSGTKDEGWFRREWARSGKKLDMGKSCLRFKDPGDLALDVIGKAIARVTARQYLAFYEATRKSKTGRPSDPGPEAPAAPSPRTWPGPAGRSGHR